MANEIDLNDTYWDRVAGFPTELRVDARWILRENGTDKPYGSLRIVSHPDLSPGYLRAIFTYVTLINPRSVEDKLRTIEDYQIKMTDLEVYSIDDDIKTETKQYEAPFKELENLFGIKIFK
jgi:hypothetical protein